MFKKSCAIIGTKLRKSTEEDNDYEKNMALVMATMMAAASLTACGGSGTASTTAADTKAADTTAADSAADTKAAPADKIGLAGSGKELSSPLAATRVPTTDSEA